MSTSQAAAPLEVGGVGVVVVTGGPGSRGGWIADLVAAYGEFTHSLTLPGFLTWAAGTQAVVEQAGIDFEYRLGFRRLRHRGRIGLPPDRPPMSSTARRPRRCTPSRHRSANCSNAMEHGVPT
ncbi:hypothetical protein FKR81_23325 [Lentzea tibetensis]|uniref:Uncharacterized protein n=1 Tax=Lentzea tibetensis TaxID=2591470 RepID=A0A563EQ01_9PSEU|nr:hypothetical protein FKR81_23325 [Lentzea tibetensis]